MKKRITLASLSALWGLALYAEAPIQEIERMVELIHLKRPGISLDTLEKTKEPFIVIKEENNETVVAKPDRVEEVRLELHALMGKKAFINGGWRKEGDIVKGYKVVYIGKRGVVLRKENTIRTLFIDKRKDKNELIKFVEREK
jgi:hypothetical protein